MNYYISMYMSKNVKTIEAHVLIREAHELMRVEKIRHLPVLQNGSLVGILTDRDIKLAASFPQAETLTVEEAMTPEPYCVSPETEVKMALKMMCENRYGSVLVKDVQGQLVGIFTSTDALNLLRKLVD